MKLSNYLSATAIVILMACNNPAETSTTTTATTDIDTSSVVIDKPAVVTPAKDCYTSTTAKDTVLLTLMGEGANVTGELMTKYAGKDKNTGTLAGHFMGDTLMADYTFMSEGKSSVREVLFLKTAEGYKEGYGASAEKDGKTKFKNYLKADFTKSTLLQKINCN